MQHGERVGQPSRPDHANEHIQQPVERSGGVQERSDQYAEPDEQPDLGHDLAEAHGDRFNRSGEADPGSQAEIERSKEQRNDRVDLEPDDQPDGNDDRDSGVRATTGLLPPLGLRDASTTISKIASPRADQRRRES